MASTILKLHQHQKSDPSHRSGSGWSSAHRSDLAMKGKERESIVYCAFVIVNASFPSLVFSYINVAEIKMIS